MYDLAALAIAAACFAFIFVLLYVLETGSDERGRRFGLALSLAVFALPRLRALPRRAVLAGMSGQGISQIVFYSVALIALGYPLGVFMARVYSRERLDRGERLVYRLMRVDGRKEQDWKSYGGTVLVFSVLFFLVLYAIQRLQGHLFLNPDHLKGVPAHLSLNTAASFVTNTNWQFYGGEYTMSYLTQMAGLAVQNFVSAAVGMAVLAAVVRGIARRSSGTLGNFWVDLYRSLVYVLLPLAVIVDGHPGLAGRAADASARTRPRTRSRARRRRSHAARSRRRSRSSSSARTAAATTTRTPPSRSRTRTASRTSSRCSRSC